MTTDLLQEKKIIKIKKYEGEKKKLLMCLSGKNCEKILQVVPGPSQSLQRQTVSDAAVHGCSSKQNKTT